MPFWYFDNDDIECQVIVAKSVPCTLQKLTG